VCVPVTRVLVNAFSHLDPSSHPYPPPPFIHSALDLERNKLTGTVPAFIAYLPGLTCVPALDVELVVHAPAIPKLGRGLVGQGFRLLL
jgi:hypothetical protein